MTEPKKKPAPAAASKPAPKPAPKLVVPEPKPEPKERAVVVRKQLTIVQKSNLMNYITNHYTASREGDAGFATKASEQMGIEVSVSTVKHYREGLGIEQIKPATVAELRAKIDELEAKLASQNSAQAEVQP